MAFDYVIYYPWVVVISRHILLTPVKQVWKVPREACRNYPLVFLAQMVEADLSRLTLCVAAKRSTVS